MDIGAYEQYVQAYYQMVYRLAFSYTKNQMDAEDICQCVFLKLYTSKKIMEEEYVRSWLIRVTINECKMLFRSVWYARRSAWDDSYAEGESTEKSPAVLEAMLQLKRQERICVYLYYYEGYRMSEIAQILGKKDSTVRVCLHRARKKLAELLKEEWDDEVE